MHLELSPQADDDDLSLSPPATIMPFGRPMRQVHFRFAPEYTPLNHGSFGAYPSAVRDYQRRLRDETDARPDTNIRFTYPGQLREARRAVAPLLGCETDELVLVPNALTGINTVLRNLVYRDGDVILYFNTAYDGVVSTIQSLEETTPVRSFCIDLVYPIDDEDIIAKVVSGIARLREHGKRLALAIFDTILTFPGVRFPWESMVRLCRQHGVLTCVDGAHGIGHIDLTHLPQVGPDFFITNCYKWLMVPRGCSVLHVPTRNHELIRTTFPTSEAYLPEEDRHLRSATEVFVRLFERVSTVDTSPYLCVLEALKFRGAVCGGEARIRQYTVSLARRGGEAMARLMGTEVLENRNKTLRDCCFANVRLPLDVNRAEAEGNEQVREGGGQFLPADAETIANWITWTSVVEFDTFIAVRYYAGAFWTRISSQIYLELRDFTWAAEVLLELCARARRGEWKQLEACNAHLPPR